MSWILIAPKCQGQVVWLKSWQQSILLFLNTILILNTSEYSVASCLFSLSFFLILNALFSWYSMTLRKRSSLYLCIKKKVRNYQENILGFHCPRETHSLTTYLCFILFNIKMHLRPWTLVRGQVWIRETRERGAPEVRPARNCYLGGWGGSLTHAVWSSGLGKVPCHVVLASRGVPTCSLQLRSVERCFKCPGKEAAIHSNTQRFLLKWRVMLGLTWFQFGWMFAAGLLAFSTSIDSLSVSWGEKDMRWVD